MTDRSAPRAPAGGLTRRSLLGAAATAVVTGSAAARLVQQVGREEYDARGGFGLVVAQHELRVDHDALGDVLADQRAGGRIAPFVSVGLSAPAHADPGLLQQAFVRTRGAAGWSDWLPAPFLPDERPDGDEAERATRRLVTQPVWVGFADALEVDAPIGIADHLQVHLVRELPAIVAHHSDAVTTTSIAPRPRIRPRSAWNAKPPKEPMVYDSSLAMAVVHHTAGGNGYSAGQVPGIIAANQAYHQNTNGWNDLAYNFVIDRFGQIWEGRFGGVTRLARGGHAAGFNTRTTGVVALGNFDTVGAPQAMLTAYHDLLGWKLGIHGVDPTTTVRYTAGSGSRSSRYPAGTTGTFPRIVGHGDVGATACPGRNLRPHVPPMRDEAKLRQGFPDVPPDSYYAAAVTWLVEHQITTGVGDTGLYKPHDPVIRAQMAAFMWRVMDRPRGYPPHGFTDVPSGSYYEDAVRWLRAEGITDGLGGPGRYSPGVDVSRAQMVAFLWRMSGRRGGGYPPHGFTDVPRGAFYEDALRWARENRITTGLGGTSRFGPGDMVTRAQMAAFLHRLASTRDAWAHPTQAPSTVLF